jgi:hypothetical protein
MTGSPARSATRASLLPLAGIVLLAAALRLHGITHDAPFSYYPDELHLLKRSLAFGSGDLNPHWFHSGALFLYLLFGLFGGTYALGRLAGRYGSPDDFAQAFFTDLTPFLVLGRGLVAAFGVATVVLVYFLGRRLFGRTAGLLAALFLATGAGPVAACQHVKDHVPAAFFFTLAAFFQARILQGGRTRDYVWSGIAMGLCMATKYYAPPLLLTLLLVHALRPKAPDARRGWLPPLAALAASVAAFFVASPYNFLDPTWFRENLLRWLQVALDKLRGAGAALVPGLLEPRAWLSELGHVIELIVSRDGLGPLVGGLALASVPVALLSGRARSLFPSMVLVPFLLVLTLAQPGDSESRHLSPAYPALALGAGWLVAGADRALGLALRPWGTRAGRAVAALAALGLVVPGVVAVVRSQRIALREDTRTLARRWIEANVPSGTRLLNDNDWVPLVKSIETIDAELEAARRTADGGAFTVHRGAQFRLLREAARRYGGPTYRVSTLAHPWWWGREELPENPLDRDMGNPYDLRRAPTREWLDEQGIEYVITTAKTEDQYLTPNWRRRFPRFGRFYTELRERWTLVREFPWEPDVRPGPSVRIWRRPA